jgi:hypothetical protein
MSNQREAIRDTTLIRHELVKAEFEKLHSKRRVVFGKPYRIHDYSYCLAMAGFKYGFTARSVENIINGWG